MPNSLDKRFRLIHRMIEGAREQKAHETTQVLPKMEQEKYTPVNPWHRRILAELDFALQLHRHDGADTAPIDAALAVLENAYSTDGVLTDSACKTAEECLLPLKDAAKSYRVIMAGHAHLDMNWKWGWDETVAIVIATFKTVLKLMDEYPEFCFSQSQASTYKIIEDYAPEMVEPIKAHIKEGRWEVTATNWVETDKNMPSLESMMNHIVYTKKYMSEKWGVDPKSLQIDFLPDTFGHNAFVPITDLLGGVRYQYHCRGLRDDITLYRWRAPNGQELLNYKEPYWYNSAITPLVAIGLPKISKRCGGLKVGLHVYGVGDHGGGPTRRDLNRALEMQGWPIFPELKFGQIREFFAAAESVRDQMPIVEKELNQIFTGCYTTQSRIKKGNRRTEEALCHAEQLSAFASKEFGFDYREDGFERSWQNTLLTHFHDILTGSCVQDSREHAMGLYQDALSFAQTRSALAMEKFTAAIDTSCYDLGVDPFERSIGAGVGYGVGKGNIPTHEGGVGINRIMHLFNTASVDRQETAKITVWDWPGDVDLLEITDVQGRVLPYDIERTASYWAHEFMDIRVEVAVPAFGYTTIFLRERDPEEVTASHIWNMEWQYYHRPVADHVLENDYLYARFDIHTGELVSLIDKATGKERIRAGESAGLRYMDAEDKTHTAWQINRYSNIEKMQAPNEMHMKKGNVLSTLSFISDIKNSNVTTTVSLGKNDRFLRIGLKVDWNEKMVKGEPQHLLSYRLPLEGSAGQILCDVPGGVQIREDKGIDVPCLRYAAAKLEDGRALALASDCKYGYRLYDSDLYVTLINTSRDPDPYPERGIHEIELYIVASEFDAVALDKIAQVCINPLQYVTNTAHKGSLPTELSMAKVESDSVIVTGIAKRNDKVAMRLYEAKGKASSVSVSIKDGVQKAVLCDLTGSPMDIPVRIENGVATFDFKANMQAELYLD